MKISSLKHENHAADTKTKILPVIGIRRRGQNNKIIDITPAFESRRT